MPNLIINGYEVDSNKIIRNIRIEFTDGSRIDTASVGYNFATTYLR